MSTTAPAPAPAPQQLIARPTVTSLTSGVAGGLAGGVVFGLMMQQMEMIPMVAALVGGSSLALGWLVHLTISVIFGVAFTVLAARWTASFGTSASLGAGYGVVLWVIGPLLLMPAKLGMPLMTFNTTTWQSLMGHIVFGVVLGLVATTVIRRSTAS